MTINPKSVDEQIEMVYTLAFGQQVKRYRPGNGGAHLDTAPENQAGRESL